MATEKWIAGSGVGFTWTSIITTEMNTLVNGNSVAGTGIVTNQTALDVFCDVSFISGGSVTPVAPAFLGVYLLPLDATAAFYGDNTIGTTAAAVVPAGIYNIGSFGPFPIAATNPLVGTITGIIMPPGSFKFAVYSQIGASLPGTNNILRYRTYNRSVA